jgi:hypothetical protein
VFHLEIVSKAASLCVCKEDVCRDINDVPLQSLCAKFVFHLGIKNILKDGVLETEDLHSGMGSGGSQPNELVF